MTKHALLHGNAGLHPYNNLPLNPLTTRQDGTCINGCDSTSEANVDIRICPCIRIKATFGLRTFLDSCSSKCLFCGCCTCSNLIGIGVVALLVLVGFSIVYFGYGLGKGTMLMLERIGLGFQTLLEVTGFAIVLGTVVGCCLCVCRYCGK